MYLTLQLFIGKVNKRLTLSYSAIKIPEFPDFSLFHSNTPPPQLQLVQKTVYILSPQSL